MILHFGDICTTDTAICGQHVPWSVVSGTPEHTLTYREYELDPALSPVPPHLVDTEPCTACWELLQPRVECERADDRAMRCPDVRELTAYNEGRLPRA